MLRALLLASILCAAPACAAPARPAVKAPVLLSIEVQPREVSLTGPRGERQLLVTGRFSDGAERDLTEAAKFFPVPARSLRVSAPGLVSGAADGEARVKVSIGRLAAWAKVTVKDHGAETPLSFQDDVIPVLTRAGCNMGACHGAAAGKGGFKLSLLGSEPAQDYPAIVHFAAGRRISRSEPSESLLLKKPTMAVPHAGGLRFKPDSREFRTLLLWLAQGAPRPVEKEPAVASLEVQPARRLVKSAALVLIPQGSGPAKPLKLVSGQRLSVTAHFKDGSTEDVTHKAQYNSLNDALARVDGEGQVAVVSKGETSVLVRYRGQAALSRFTVPYRELRSFPKVAQANFIDELVAAKWKEMGLTPSARCTDAEYIRRVYLDVTGTLPKPDEIRAFLADTSPDKRAKLADAVLRRPEYVDYWTLKWGDLLRNNRQKLGDKGMWSFYNWLRASFRENKPLDRFARELLTAQGSTYSNGPANYYRVASNPSELAETTAQVFLGVRLACSKCHHHPFEKWGQDDYWQIAAFFSRVGLKGSQEFGIFGGEQVVRLNDGGEVNNPHTGKQMVPTPLDGEPIPDKEGVDRRKALADWLTDPKNLMFSRNIANRYWGYLMGRGLVDPIDDIRATNPPSNPELLDALAKDFAEHGFDVKRLIRSIITSETYQLSSNPTPANKQDEVFYTKYAVKRMGAEELLDAIDFATGSPDKFPNLPAGMRAVQLPDPGVQSYFLDTFGRPERAIACECERSAEPNMAQALHLMNGDYLQSKINNAKGRLATLLAANKPDADTIEELYLVTFSRLPGPGELMQAKAMIDRAPKPQEGYEDLFWALLNSREFLFKH